jgi:hypothetical protein
MKRFFEERRQKYKNLKKQNEKSELNNKDLAQKL